MSEYQLPKEIEQRFNELPKSVQDIILNSGWEKTTRSIVEKYNLRIDQGAEIERETMFIMFGFDKPQNFINNISKQAKLDEKTAIDIAVEINDQVFSKIRTGVEKVVPTKEQRFEEVNPTESLESREEILKQIEEVDSEGTKVEDKPSENNVTQEEKPKTGIEERLEKPQVSQPSDPYREPIE